MFCNNHYGNRQHFEIITRDAFSTSAPVFYPNITLGYNYILQDSSASVAGWDICAPELIIKGSIVNTGNTPKPINRLVILNHTFDARSQLKLLLKETDSPFIETDILYESEWTPMAKEIPLGAWRMGVDQFGYGGLLNSPFILRVPEIILARSFIIKIKTNCPYADNNGDPYPSLFTMRRVFLGLATTFSQTVEYGMTIQHRTESQSLRLLSGRPVSVSDAIRKKHLTVTFPHLTDSDRFQLIRTEEEIRNDTFVVAALPTGDWRDGEMAFLAKQNAGAVYEDQFIDSTGVRELSFVEV